MPDARDRIMRAATARPARGIVASLLIVVSDAAMGAAESLIGVPSGTVLRAAAEYTADVAAHDELDRVAGRRWQA
jgi:hypothetical protein